MSQIRTVLPRQRPWAVRVSGCQTISAAPRPCAHGCAVSLKTAIGRTEPCFAARTAMRPGSPDCPDATARPHRQVAADYAILPVMAEALFLVIPQKGRLFAVAMTPNGGRMRLIRDFRSKGEADAWILQTKRLLGSCDPLHKAQNREGRH